MHSNPNFSSTLLARLPGIECIDKGMRIMRLQQRCILIQIKNPQAQGPDHQAEKDKNPLILIQVLPKACIE